MKKQFKIFAALFLSAAAGMTGSEMLSYHFESSSVTESRLQAERAAPPIVAELRLHDEAIN